MIGSFKEKMKHLPRISLDINEPFIYEIKENGVVVAEILIQVHELSRHIASGKSDVKIHSYNLNGLKEEHLIQPS